VEDRGYMRDMVEGEGERDGECASERSYMIERKGKGTHTVSHT
jgi:hypothetical protein